MLNQTDTAQVQRRVRLSQLKCHHKAELSRLSNRDCQTTRSVYVVVKWLTMRRRNRRTDAAHSHGGDSGSHGGSIARVRPVTGLVAHDIFAR